jgi:hypothetical protein
MPRARKRTISNHTQTETLHDLHQCPICLLTVVHPVATPCGHVFCRFCITTWLNTNPVCPLCRATSKSTLTLLLDNVQYHDPRHVPPQTQLLPPQPFLTPEESCELFTLIMLGALFLVCLRLSCDFYFKSSHPLTDFVTWLFPPTDFVTWLYPLTDFVTWLYSFYPH